MRNIPTKTDGISVLPSAEVNSIADEIKTAVTSSGQTLSNTDSMQLGRALTDAARRGNFYTDAGTANSCTLTNGHTAITSYVDGMLVRFIKSSTNTSTVTINVSGIGAVNLLSASGASLSANQLPLGSLVEARYSTIDGAFVLNRGVSVGGENLTELVALNVSTSLTLAHMGTTILTYSGAASTVTMTLPALSTVPEGGRFTIMRNFASDFSVTVDGSGAETVGSISSQQLWGVGALIEVTKINALWVVTRSLDPRLYLALTGNTPSVSDSVIYTLILSTLNTSTEGIGNSWYDTGSNYIVPQIAGSYAFTASIDFSINTTGLRGISLFKNGIKILPLIHTMDLMNNAIAVSAGRVTITYPDVVANGSSDYFQVVGYQTSGAPMNMDAFLSATLVKRTY